MSNRRNPRWSKTVQITALVLAAWVTSGGLSWARPVRVEGNAAWWFEISRAWERFYALRSYRARVDLDRGEAMWEVVRAGQPGTEDLRQVVFGRDSQGEWRQETVQKGGHEVWQVSWIPTKIRDPRDPRRIRQRQALESLARRMAPDAGVSVRQTAAHDIFCVRATRPLFITAPGSEFRRPLETVRMVGKRRGSHVGPDRVARSTLVYEYRLKDPRTGDWTTPITFAVDEGTGLPVQASYVGAGGSLAGPALVPLIRKDRFIGPASIEYYDHNTPITIAVPPRDCRR